jgi:hypothetical protein
MRGGKSPLLVDLGVKELSHGQQNNSGHSNGGESASSVHCYSRRSHETIGRDRKSIRSRPDHGTEPLPLSGQEESDFPDILNIKKLN